MSSLLPQVAYGDEPFVGHIVLDVPADHPTLRFTQVAQALAAIIQGSEPRFAVGIFGGWGSGKSTLMDEIERLVGAGGAAVVVRFNAWRYEREPHLIIPLLDTIRASLSEWASRPEHHGAEADRIRDIARRVGRVVRALVRATSLDVGLPGAASISVDPGKALDELTPKPDDLAGSPQSLYFGAFQELNRAFSEVQDADVSRIVVFVDDLDRCLPDRALTVLESMKLFFDMPGFVFVVGLDERVVESAVRTKFAGQVPGESSDLDRQLERDYLKKIFQVPYTLPAMVPGQLDDLIAWLDQYGALGEGQRIDLHERVRRYLGHVATEGRVNPREVKRFINAYTLGRMIRPDLDPDAMLALQTIDFRKDWEQFYEDVVLAEPDLFGEVVGGLAADEHAFEDLWPEVGVVPFELSAFLRSAEAKALQRPDLERYVSFLETTRTTQHWVKDAMHDVGTLRRYWRSIGPGFRFGSPQARGLAEQAKDVLGRLESHASGPASAGLQRPLTRLRDLVDELVPPPAADGSTTGDGAEQRDVWRRAVEAETDVLRQELRLIRRSSTFTA